MKYCKTISIIFSLFVLIAITRIFVFDGYGEIRAKKQAKINFMSSRPNIEFSDTYKFISRGIKYNMTEECVNTIMDSADEKLIKLHQYTPTWDGYLNIYKFKYGPSWIQPFSKKTKYFYEEWFWVYFDHEGNAKKVQRSMVKGDDFMKYKDVVIDLKTETIKQN